MGESGEPEWRTNIIGFMPLLNLNAIFLYYIVILLKPYNELLLQLCGRCSFDLLIYLNIKTFFFSLRFTIKLRGRHRDFPCNPYPHHVHNFPHCQYPLPEQYTFFFLKIYRPTLTHYNHPKSIFYITTLWFTRYGTFSESEQMYNDMDFSMWYIIQNIFTDLKKPPCYTFSSVMRVYF